MKIILLFLSLHAILSVTLFAGSNNEESEFIEGTIIIQASEIIEVIQREPELITDKTWFNEMIPVYNISNLSQLGGRIIPPYKITDYLFYSVVFDTTYTVEEVQDAFAAKSEVITSEPSYMIVLDGINTNDFYADDMWALEKIGMNEVWGEFQEYGSEDVVIGVIDSGVDLGAIPEHPHIEIHEDLRINLWTNDDEIPENGRDDDNNGIIDDYYGWNPFAFDYHAQNEDETIPQDFYGHGTHVIGTIGAMTNNEIGVAGIVGGWDEIPGCRVMAVRIGGTRTSRVLPDTIAIDGLYYAYLNGANIINMSWHVQPTTHLYECISIIANDEWDLWDEGFEPILVAAAGNDGDESLNYPAAYPEVISIAATTIADQKASYSQYGNPYINISAPGGQSPYKIMSTMPFDNLFYNHTHPPFLDSEYSFSSGTSMASPHVAGVLALMKSSLDLNNEDLKWRLFGTSDDIYQYNPPEYLGKLGAGRINAYRAINPGEQEHPSLRMAGIGIFNDNNNNGIFEFGEEVSLEIDIKNWWVAAQNVIGALELADPANEVDLEIINGENISFGDIPQGGIGVNLNIILSDDPEDTTPREVELKLTLEMDNYPNTELHFNIYIYANVYEPFAELINNPEDEEIVTEITSGDIDNDGVDELAVGSYNFQHNESFIHLYKDGIWASNMQLTDSISTKISFADLDDDGNKEIVAGDKSGIIYIWNCDMELLTNFNTVCEIYSIAIEDVNGNGKLDIVGNGNPNCVFVIYDALTNPEVFYLYLDNPDGEMLSEVSVADVDFDSFKEAVFIYHNIVDDFHSAQLIVVNFVSRGIGGYESEDIWDNGIDIFVDLHSTNVILIKPQIEYVHYHRIYFGLGTVKLNIDPNLSYTSVYKVYCYDARGDINQIWVESPDIGSTSNVDYEGIKIIAGEFDDDEGIEILKSKREAILDVEEGERLDYIFNTYCLFGYIHNNFIPEVITNIADDNYNDVILKRGVEIRVLNTETEEINYLRMLFPDEDIPVKSLVLGNAVFEEENDLYIVLNNGFVFRVNLEIGDINEWEQHQNNARNTGSYFQPLPEVIHNDITVRHNAVIDKAIRFSQCASIDITLTIEPNNEILFTPQGSIIGGNIQALGTEEDSITFAGLCADTTKDYWKGISIERNSQCNFKHCYLQNAITALLYNDIENQDIENCTIENNIIGIALYHSSTKIKENIIVNNDYGIVGYNRSMPILTGLGPVATPFRNAIVNNDSIGIFLDSSIPYLNNGYNDIYNTFGGCYIELINYPGRVIFARRNYWGTTNIPEIYTHLEPPEVFVIEPICQGPNTNYNPFNTPGFDLLKEAYTYLVNVDYTNAENTFKNLIETYPETQEADQSISGLFICYKESEGNWDEFEAYINAQLNQQDISETTQKLLFSYLNLCKREKEEYDIAIANYESILENNPTYEDSCYTVIDIGNTYLEAESGGRSVSCQYPELIPISAELHQQKSRELLNSILTGKHIHSQKPEISKLILSQNYPNPYRHNTTISYAIPKSGKVSLKIYNIKGQLVKTLVNGHKEKGYYTEIWDGKNNNGKRLANGIYFYKIKIGSKSKVRKMLLLR